MKQLIEALNIFLKYGNSQHPIHCEDEELTVLVSPSLVSKKDKEKLKGLGFCAEDDHFVSSRYADL